MIVPSLFRPAATATFHFGRNWHKAIPYSFSYYSRKVATTTSRKEVPTVLAPTDHVLALIFDTETTGRTDFKKPASDPSQPELVQLGMILVDTTDWTRKMQVSLLVKDVSFIQPGAQQVHGISVEECQRCGVPRALALQVFRQACSQADILVAHNLAFDKMVMETVIFREGSPSGTSNLETMDDAPVQHVCTMLASTDILEIPGKFGKFKWPKLEEAQQYFGGGEIMRGSHNALVDAEACLSVFRGLVAKGSLKLLPRTKSIVSLPKTECARSAAQLKQRKVSPTVAVRSQGLIVEEDDKSEFVASGNTYPHRQELKLLGGTWDAAKKVWRFEDPSKLALVRRLAGRHDDEESHI